MDSIVNPGDCEMIDCHVHTDYTIDSNMSIEEAASKAAELGLDYMCFTQHLELEHLKPGEVAMDPSLMGEYFKRVEKASEEYGVALGTGIEVGYVVKSHREAEKILEEYAFDFIIGSIHEIVPNIIISGPSGIEKIRAKGKEKFVDNYFDLVEEMINLNFFDVVGHLDVLNKYEEMIFGQGIYPIYSERVLSTAKLLRKTGKGFEVNTQGIRRIGQPWPREEIVATLHNVGISTVAFGSDAHETEYIAYGWDKVMELLRGIGYKELSYFVQRKRKSYKIPKKA